MQLEIRSSENLKVQQLENYLLPRVKEFPSLIALINRKFDRAVRRFEYKLSQSQKQNVYN